MVSHWLLLAAAAFVAGVINAVAGGGSLVSFPALLFTGMPAITANATNTLAIWPGTVSSAWAYRKWLSEERHRATVLAIPSLIGGLMGSWVLLHTSEQAFRTIVPWLILLACGLLSFQGKLSAWLTSRMRTDDNRVPPLLWIVQLAIAFYGGYFGAGIGILMLAAMGILLTASLQHANALKVLFSLLCNGISCVYFIWMGAASLPQAGLMAVTGFIGGYAGAHLAQRLPAPIMRAVVVTYGVIVAVVLFRKG
jgi:uncharacterized membrane protein YfcA